MNKHTAVLPDGNIATRNSKTRVYTHAVAYRPTYKGIQADRWYVSSYAGSLALAEKAKAALISRGNHPLNNGNFAGGLYAIIEVEVA